MDAIYPLTLLLILSGISNLWVILRYKKKDEKLNKKILAWANYEKRAG